MIPVVLRFLFDVGQFLDVPMAETEAQQIVNGWQAGSLKDKIRGQNPQGSWVVDTKRIVGLFYTYQQVQSDPASNLSGYNPPPFQTPR